MSQSTERPRCAGCRTVISERRCMNCTGCSQVYDLQCANLSPKRYKAMNDENKRKWRCSECTSKQPKGDNNDTPVRATTSASSMTKGFPITKDGQKGECLLAGGNINVSKRATTQMPIPVPNVNYITEEKMKELLNADKKEMRQVLESCVQGLTEQLNSIQVKCTGNQESLSFVSKQYDELKKEILDLKKLLSTELKNIKEENQSLKETIASQSSRIKVLEEDSLKQQQWARIQNIEVTGIPENKDEHTSEVILKVAHHIGVSIEPSDIEFAHRVQPRRASSSASRVPRSIVVRLRQRMTKDRIIAAARKHHNLNAKELGLGGEPNRIFVNEHLTKENKMLLSSCKQKAREADYKFVWTKNCRIYVRRGEDSPPIAISSPSEVSKIV